MVSSNAEKNWLIFFVRFEKANNKFVANLSRKYPGLSKSQFRICIYLRSGQNTRSIANQLEISIRSVESHCYRIRQKIDLDHTVNLTTHLYSV